MLTRKRLSGLVVLMISAHLILVLEHPDLLDHLLDLEAEEAEEGELEEADHAEADHEERVGRRVQPLAHRALAPAVVVPVRARARGEPEMDCSMIGA